MKFTNVKIILIAFVCLSIFLSNSGFAGDCGNDDDSMQMVSDCYGNCCPMAWVFDDICDNGVRDWPVNSGIYIYLNCQEFYCDLYQCEGCTLECPEGQAPDCNGNCAPVEWITDDICDVGQRTFNGNAIVLACQEYGCDAQTCDGVCWEHYGEWSLDNIGACCDGDSCSELTRSDCWELGYTFMGSNTQCQTNTCLCGEDWIADCNGNCIPFRTAAGGYCSHGEHFDPDGIYDNGDEFYIDLDCQALACGLSGCIGNCPGACCTGGECVVTDTWDECLQLGGVFLGSYASCGEGGSACNAELKTIQLPDTELYWSGNLGNVDMFPQWIDIAGDVLVAGSAVWNDDYGHRLGLCVYRYDSSKDDWIEEALIELPENRYPTFDNDFCYSTDGNRIAVTSIVEPEGKNARKVIDIYANDGDGWYFEDSVDEGIPFGDDEMNSFPSSIDILGDVLIAGHSSMNEDSSKNNFGAVFLYHFNNGLWEKEDTIESIADGSLGQVDRQFGLSVALGDGIAAIMSEESLSVFDISSGVGVGVKYFDEISSHNHPHSKSLDIDSKTNRIMSPVGDPFSNWSVMGSGIYEYDGMDWVLTAVLSPFDYVANDAPGYIVDIEGDTALITSPRDDDLGYDTGSAYLWRHDGTSWIFKAKLWSDWADAGDQFGIGAALHDSSAYITGNLESDGDCIKIFSPRQTAWINPEGGSLEDAVNWDPHLPSSDESVLFSLRSDTNILVSDDFPFDHIFVGPGDYTFDLQGSEDLRYFESSGHAMSMQGVPGLPGVFALTNGTLAVNGDIHIGEDELPGGISLRNSGEEGGLQGRIFVYGTWLQHEAGELDVTLKKGQPAPVKIFGEQAPRIGGVLSINLDDDYVAEEKDKLPIMTTNTVDDDTETFHIVMVNDPLPDGLYMRIGYSSTLNGGSNYETYAEVLSLDDLFGYGDPNGANVNGVAVDVAVGNVAGGSRGATDTFDDIVVITNDTVYILISDGFGGAMPNQVAITSESFNALSSVDIGDFDNDGDNDIVVTDASSEILIPIFNNPEQSQPFEVGNSIGTGPLPVDIAVMDTNADDIDDVIVVCQGYSADSSGSIDFFSMQDGVVTGDFNQDGSIDLNGQPGGIDPGDVNNDKDLATFVVSLKGSNGVGKGNRNSSVNGGFNWTVGSITNVATGPTDISSADLNADGILDVVVVCPDSDTVCILTGLSDGTFSQPLQIDIGESPTSLAILDFDNDSSEDQDIAIVTTDPATNNRVVRLLRNDTSLNNGVMIFANAGTLDSGVNPILVAKGDLDSDAVEDLVTINTSNTFFNNGANNVIIRTAGSDNSCPEDLDGSQVVGVDDLLLLIAAWGQTDSVPADLDGNGIVGIDDLLILISAWGPCNT